jgi:hypothetical protein
MENIKLNYWALAVAPERKIIQLQLHNTFSLTRKVNLNTFLCFTAKGPTLKKLELLIAHYPYFP